MFEKLKKGMKKSGKKRMERKGVRKGSQNAMELQKTETVLCEDAVRVSVGAAQDIGMRDNQQDSIAYTDRQDMEKGVMALVADGMGGLENGAEVSGIISYIFKERFQNMHEDEMLPEIILKETLRKANYSVCDYVEKAGGALSGSTLVCAYVERGFLDFISVGDSRIYLLRGEHLLQLNREHIYTCELEEQYVNELIGFEEMMSHRERKSLTSYVGMNRIAHIDRNLTPIQLCHGDKLLLVSDGVFGTLEAGEMEEALMKNEMPEAAAEQILEMVKAHQKPKQDNASAVVLFCE